MVEIIRGNSVNLTLVITQNDEPYKFADGDRILFTIKKSRAREAAVVIQKIVPPTDVDADGNIIVSFVPQDTINIKEGSYYYDFGIVSGDNFYTAASCDTFNILPALSEIGGVVDG